ncbi:DUF397 domain-containing protein [Micromonospora sp. WMMD975]|uniref:DUF397 domain-containing protein n=1 Tax=Micromonospora sp. WMMD975 TaxID=3016087 RepID=UPI00249CB181|nr:DUF397 domain-containing protein [Micromonospora sp. WMMD975]WFE36517.1 DUF397 domain-containing protein [Micromonospora sp. WMMD975]
MDLTRVTWRRSTRSGSSGNCVEVATLPQAVIVRDSKDRQGPMLSVSADRWAGFVRGIKAGTFDA